MRSNDWRMPELRAQGPRRSITESLPTLSAQSPSPSGGPHESRSGRRVGTRAHSAVRLADAEGTRCAVTQLDPVEEFHALKPNTRAHAAFWLRAGEFHPDIHFVIRDRLESFIRRVEEAGPEIRARLLGEIPPEGTA